MFTTFWVELSCKLLPQNSSASPTRRQRRNNVYSPIKSVISSVWQSCCFQCVRIVSRGQLCRIQPHSTVMEIIFIFSRLLQLHWHSLLFCVHTRQSTKLHLTPILFSFSRSTSLSILSRLPVSCRLSKTVFQPHRWTFSRIILWNFFSSYFPFSIGIRTRRFSCF